MKFLCNIHPGPFDPYVYPLDTCSYKSGFVSESGLVVT